MAGNRIVVVGASGSGKSTLARRLAQLLDFPYVELDSLHWEPDWVEASDDVSRSRIKGALTGDSWVVDGNYGKIRDLVWSQADTVVWLDYSFMRVIWQVFWRTLDRLIFKRTLWSGNRESWRLQFLSRHSLFLWVCQSWPKYRREYPTLFKEPEFHHRSLIRLRAPNEARQWLEEIGLSPGVSH